MPVSRHTEVRAADLPANVGLEVLADSAEAGPVPDRGPAARRGPALVGRAVSDILVSGNRSPDALAEVLSGLAEFGLSPRAVKVHRHGDA